MSGDNKQSSQFTQQYRNCIMSYECKSSVISQSLHPSKWLPSVIHWKWPTPVYLLTYLLTPWSRVLLEKLTGIQLVKKFPAFYGIRRFITAFTSTHHLSLSWASLIPSIPPHPTSCRSIFILSSNLCLGLPSGLFASGFSTKTPFMPLLYPICIICPAHLILLDFITQTILGDQYRLLRPSLCSFLHSSVTSFLLHPNILLNTLFSKILNLRSSLNVSDQVSHPYTTTGKIIVLYILICKLLVANWKTKDSASNDSKHSLTSICS